MTWPCWCLVALLLVQAHASSVHLGYSASFQGLSTVAGLKSPVVNFSDPGWRDIDEEFTVAYWYKHSLQGTRNSPVVFQIVSSKGRGILQCGYDVCVLNDSEYIWFQYNVLLRGSHWSHLALAFRNTHLSVFENGVLLFEQQLEKYPMETKNDLYLFFGGNLKNVYGPDHNKVIRSRQENKFFGNIDDFKIYSKALERSEMEALYNSNPYSAAVVDPWMVVQYSFEMECSGSSATSSLLDQACAKSIFRNLGVSGEEYDLLRGSVYDEHGFGDTYRSTVLSSKLDHFEPPMFSLSQVPTHLSALAAGATFSSTPIVYRVDLGENVTCRLPAADSALVFVEQPMWGVVFRGSDGSVLGAGDSLDGEQELVFHARTQVAIVPSWFSVMETGSSRTQQFHMWPVDQHFLISQFRAEYVLPESSSLKIDLADWVRSPSGADLHIQIISMPKTGTLSRVKRTWRDSVDDYITWETAEEVSSESLLINGTEGLLFLLAAPKMPPGSNVSDTDEFTFAYLNLDGSIQSETMVLRFRYEPTDTPARATGGSAIVEEDYLGGVEISLNISDRESLFGLHGIITKLPQLGDLYVLHPNGDRERIETAFDTGAIHAGKPLLRQYASKDPRASTFRESLGVVRGHPFMILGPPTCGASYAANSGCVQAEVEDPSWMPDVGTILYVYYPPPMEELYVAAQIINKYRSNLTTEWVADVRLLPQYVRVNDTWLPCREVFLDVSDPATVWNSWVCSVKHAASDPDEGYILRGLNRSQLEFPDGFWAPKYDDFIPGLMTSTLIAGSYGKEFMYEWDQAFGYDQREYLVHPYTEWFQVSFETPVFPVGVSVGHPFNGASIVNVKVLDLDTQQWRLVYTRSLDLQTSSMSAESAHYIVFEEAFCQQTFLTDTVRVELDTSELSGIPGAKVDYIELHGREASVPAVFEASGTRQARLVYVPRGDQFGIDEFEFAASDCVGARSRSSQLASFQVTISPTPDPITFSGSDDIFLCGLQEEFNGVFKVSNPDKDQYTVQVSEQPVFATVIVGNSDYIGDNTYSFNYTVQVECKNLSESLTAGVFKLVATRDNMAFDEGSMQFRVLRENTQPVSPEIVSICMAMFSVVTLLALTFAIWTYWNASSFLAMSSPGILMLTITGVVVSSLAIPLSLFSDNVSEENADLRCNMVLWFYCLGTMITYSSMYVKIRRASLLFDSNFVMGMVFGSEPDKARFRNAVSLRRMQLQIFVMVACDFLICLIAFFKAPLKFIKTPMQVDLQTGYTLLSSKRCYNSSFAMYGVIIFSFHTLVLVVLAVSTFKTRNLAAAFSEARFLSYAIFSMLQITFIGGPVIYMASHDRELLMFSQSSFIFLINTSLLAVIFLPKVVQADASQGGSRLRRTFGSFSGASRIDPACDNSVNLTQVIGTALMKSSSTKPTITKSSANQSSSSCTEKGFKS